MHWETIWTTLYHLIAFGALGFTIGVLAERRREEKRNK